MKIRFEIDVPDGDFCHDCNRSIEWEPCTLGCSLFWKRVHSSQKLPECKAAEVRMLQVHSCDIPGCLSCGNPESADGME